MTIPISRTRIRLELIAIKLKEVPFLRIAVCFALLGLICSEGSKSLVYVCWALTGLMFLADIAIAILFAVLVMTDPVERENNYYR